MHKAFTVIAVAVMVIVVTVTMVRGIPIEPVSEELVTMYGIQRKTEIGPDDTELLMIIFSEREIAVWTAYLEQKGVVTSWLTLANITYSIDYVAYTVNLESTERNLVTARDIKLLSMFFDLAIGVSVDKGE